MSQSRDPVTHEDIFARLGEGDEKFDTIMEELRAMRSELNNLADSVKPLVENTDTLKGVAEVTRAASIWRKFFVGALGLLVLVGAAGGVVAGVVLSVKHWIIEGSASG
jgi:hypothetical protein